MTNDNYNIARFARDMGTKGFDFNGNNVARCINCNPAFDRECWQYLADLIEPTFKIDDVWKWAFTNLEGSDEPEFSMYDAILNAIDMYHKEINENNKRLEETNNEQVD